MVIKALEGILSCRQNPAADSLSNPHNNDDRTYVINRFYGAFLELETIDVAISKVATPSNADVIIKGVL